MSLLYESALFLFKNRLYRDLKSSLKISHEDRQEILKLQNNKFVRLIDHARINVPYYSQILKNLRDIDDLAGIPFLTKKIIKEKADDLKTKNLKEKDFRKNSTSGSTGETMYFYSDMNNTYAEACAIRGDMFSGWNYGEKKITIWGALRDFHDKPGFKARINQKYLQKSEILSSFNMTEKDIDHYIDFINNFKPSLLIGYPTGLLLIAEHMIKYNRKITVPLTLVSAGETLYDFQREIIEKVFGHGVFNRYGCREVIQIASECEAHNGLHISADHLIAEVVNEKGEPASPGEAGEIIVTDLDNYAFPFIRYKIGDIGILKDPDYRCSCGVNLPMLERVEGRTMDVIVGTNGNRVTGTFWTLFFRHNFKGIEKFQVIQETSNQINIWFEINESYNNRDNETIINEIKKLLGDDLQIEIHVVDEISKTATGKHRWIISKVSPYA
ncbi:MAG TPA: hypothetical protein DDW27_00990 [Bacteroidales bacterium]|nr:hypothetical protein [Bacteroidales bacterium]